MALHRYLWIVVPVMFIVPVGVPRVVAATPGCAPAVRVEGDSSTVEAVIADLDHRGIGTSDSPGCPVVRARVDTGVDGLVLTIVDTDGRIVERTANGAEAAATLIESWTRSDVVAPLLAPRLERLPVVSTSVPTRVNAIEATTLTVTSRSGDVRGGPDLSVTASGETSFATDGSIWFGVSAGVCLPMGPACASVLARVSSDRGLSGGSRDLHTGRLAADVLLGASLPIRRGRLTVLPGLAIGVGWMRTSALASSNGGDSIDIDSGGLRGSASVRMSFNLSTNLALDLGIAADVAPVAHSEPYDAQVTPLAGEPHGYFRSSLGIRIGVP